CLQIKYKGDLKKALEEVKTMLGEEVNTTGRDIVERLKKGLPVEDEVIVGDLIAEYGEQVIAEAIEFTKVGTP
ncbi:MAG: hypothetical protein Q6368_007175, partial [Candidatus Baldrarchaeota archaeon]